MAISLSRRLFLSAAAALPLAPCTRLSAAAAGAPERRISGPFAHDNLAIYLVHGASAPGPVPLTLAEAMQRGHAVVYETGNVSELSIENTGLEDVFVQSGDIVKGGKQDRVLTISMILPAKSGKLPIASFCVEQGRWTARGREDVSRFGTAASALPSREAKLAMKVTPKLDPAAAAAAAAGGRPGIAQRGNAETSAQGKVWDSVRKTQTRLSDAVGAPVAARESATSLQLTLENEKLRASQAAYAAALSGKGAAESDVIGFVFAINGKINSADLYPSNGLFRKMWAKNLNASVTEALAAKSESAGAAPDADAVLAFLDAAESGNPSEREITRQVRLETREAAGNFMFETRGRAGALLHRNYLAK